MKSQAIRAADVAAIAPLMLWAAVELRRRAPLRAIALGVMAIGTFGYNFANYLEHRPKG